ncbi:MAG: fatty acid desaturase [Leptolyngbyaceae cyanobacterium MO_188.B28]|nr:fatty acid desaturase [Leptolyngbyaceae cyanobacterium MO_188.B28]
MSNNFSTSDQLIQDLRKATVDLHRVNPWMGFFRFSGIGLVVIGLLTLAWLTQNAFIFLGLVLAAGAVYALWLICTHDAVHHTLTGWVPFENLASRLISWPLLWPYGLYAELHRLHHGWNGLNLCDPERVQWTYQEYQSVNPLLQWYVRRQWIVDIFVLGGIGMIVKTVMGALRFQSVTPSIRFQLFLDAAGILLVQGAFLTVAMLHHAVFKYLICWFILERIIGVVIQTRDHLEHYALWGRFGGHQITQLYACRNLKTSPVIGWLMGGLNYHAVHHTFPGIPFNHLPEAFQRIQAVLRRHHLPLMKLDGGYFQEFRRLSQQPSLIGESDLTNLTGRHQMIPVG